MTDQADIDREWPSPLSREEAADHLASIIPGAYFDVVWNEIIAPLYDARRFAAEWPRGYCRRCHIPHPSHPTGRNSPRAGHHVMRCPKYVGPLTHRSARTDFSVLGELRHECTCGASYPDRTDDDRPGTCPQADQDWRGPRPGQET